MERHPCVRGISLIVIRGGKEPLTVSSMTNRVFLILSLHPPFKINKNTAPSVLFYLSFYETKVNVTDLAAQMKGE